MTYRDVLNSDAKAMSEALEAMVDKVSLSGVLDLLSGVCHDKAEHLRSNWQDDGMAREWTMDARRIERLSSTLNVC